MKGSEKMQTLKEIEACESEFLTPKDISKILGCGDHSIRVQAARCPEKLGFPVSVIGTRVKIPKQGFLRFMRGELQQDEKIFDWMTMGLTCAFAVSALGVVGSFEQGRLDTAGFFIGQAVCIAGIVLLTVAHHLLSKKRKSPRGAATPTRGKEKYIHINYIKQVGGMSNEVRRPPAF